MEEGPPAEGVTRRDFLGFVVGVTGGAALGVLGGLGIAAWTEDDTMTMVTAPPAGASSDDMLVFYPRVRVGSLSELQEGVPVAFEYPLKNQPAALVKLGRPAKYGLGPDSDVVAFSTTCTHMGWPLAGQFKPEECVFGPCPGHLTTFDACVGGQVTLGQATQNLPQVVLVIEDDTIYAEGVLGLIYGYRNNLADGTPLEVAT